MTGSHRVAKAAPDGYQFVLGGTFMALNQTLFKSPLYNLATDLAPVALIVQQPVVLITRKDLPAINLSEFTAYAKATTDLLYRFFPEREDEAKQFDEVEGIANRTDYDLTCHTKGGKTVFKDGSSLPNEHAVLKQTYFDQPTNAHLLPYVIEPSGGVDRITLAFLMDIPGPQNARGRILFDIVEHAEDLQEVTILSVSDYHGQLIPLTEAWIEYWTGDERRHRSTGTIIVNRDQADWMRQVTERELVAGYLRPLPSR